MPLFFRKSIKILPGVKLNINKKSTSVTFGHRGARVTTGSKGTHVSIGIPGTGIYFREKIGSKKRKSNTKELPTISHYYSTEETKENMLLCGAIVVTICIILFFYSLTWSWYGGHSRTNIYITYDFHWLQWIFYPLLGIFTLFGLGCLLFSSWSPNRDFEGNDNFQSEDNAPLSENQQTPNIDYVNNTNVTKQQDSSFSQEDAKFNYNTLNVNDDLDPLFEDAAFSIIQKKCCEVSYIQRKFGIGYNRAGRILEQLENAGIVSKKNNKNQRNILIADETGLIKLLKNMSTSFPKNSNKNLPQFDPLFEEAANAIVISQFGSVLMLQRRFSISYEHASRLMDQLEMCGIVGFSNGAGPREVILKNENQLNTLIEKLKG